MEIINIVTKEEEQNRLLDGLRTLLYLDEEDFNYVIRQLQLNSQPLYNIRFFYTTDGCEAPNNKIQLGLEKEQDEKGNRIGRYYFGGEQYSIRKILETLQAQIVNFEPGSPKYIRIKKLLESRGLESFKSMYLTADGSNQQILNMVFEILSNQDTLEKFLDFERNAQYFSVDGKNIPINEYLKYLGEFFGDKSKEGKLPDDNTISKDFYIPNLDEYKQKYSQIVDQINMDRYTNQYYVFDHRKNFLKERVIREEEEPDWEINPEIYKSVYSDMPKGLSLEEKAVYIYSKLCKEFLYDEGYLYRDKLSKINYESTFSKEHLEGLVPGDKITCYDFARIFTKMINELEGDIEAVIISEGANQGHFWAGFYTGKVSAEVEPVNIGESNDVTNDLMRAKNGIKLKGIKAISDREGILEKAMEAVYPQVIGKQPVSVQEHLQELKQIPIEEAPDDLETKLKAFIEVMKANNISGNEFVQTMEGARRAGFFGLKLDCAYLGKLQGDGDEKRYIRKLLLRQKEQDSTAVEITSNALYLLDSDSLSLSLCSDEEIISKLNSGELVYESEKHKMPGIDKEVEQ